MKIEMINQTNYANIYCLYDDNGKPIGTKEVVLAGKDVGEHYYSLTSKSRADVKKLFKLVSELNGGFMQKYRLETSVMEHYPKANERLYVARYYDNNNKMVAQGGSSVGKESAISFAKRNLYKRFGCGECRHKWGEHDD